MNPREQTRNLWTFDGDAPPASEDEVLALIDAHFPSRTPHTPLGRGHDCAELAGLERRLALSTDMFWQDSHFRPEYFTPREAGAKALTGAVSDLAAAGAVPLGFSLDLLLPPDLGARALDEALSGMADKARQYGMILCGGDLARGDCLGFSLTVWGGPVDPAAPFLHRGGAEAGDVIFLVGRAGLARVGLGMLERLGREALRDWPASCAAHLSPEALLAEGQALAALARDLREEPGAEGKKAPRLSLMDVSDGLIRDLPRLLRAGDAGLGADLEIEPDLIPEEVRVAARGWGCVPEHLFLLGGEDYALAGTCPDSLWPLVRRAVPGAARIGRVREEPGLFLSGNPLALEGFDHFAATDKKVPARFGPVAEAGRALVAAGREAWEAGLMAGYNGNISCRLTLDSGPEAGEACLITRAGVAKGRLTEGDFSLLSLSDGQLLQGPPASTESPVHLGIYRNYPQSRVILHTHPPHLLALCLALPVEKRLVLPLPEAETYRGRLAWTPFFPPGSAALGEAVAEAARTHAAVWMERHGLVVHGPDLGFVLSLSEELEQLARVQLFLLTA